MHKQTLRLFKGKLALAVVAAAATALVGTASGAMATNGNNGSNGKPTRAECSERGISNYGQCVRQWAMQNGGGNGYGGSNTININPHININGNNNAVQVIINIIFG